MFGYPPYRGIDPTIFVSIFLPLFFGFMFSDVGYGILLLFVSLLLLVKATPRKKIVYDSGFVLLICSLSTILFGIFFGSFFGNLFGFSPLLFDPFKNAKTVLITALVLGLLHLNVGILLSILSNLEKKDYRAIITGNLSIVFLELGVALLFLESTALGILALLMSGILFIANTGIMGLMDITGFVGTWFSYARLLALSLATGGIALGINIMAEQLNHIALLGPILFILLLIFGHLFNFAMNVLGSSIHSVRLHYIEFFSQFYEGGGTPFTPYTTKKTKDTL
jgi:V/A-type H+-transporting ATPase subunit I